MFYIIFSKVFEKEIEREELLFQSSKILYFFRFSFLGRGIRVLYILIFVVTAIICPFKFEELHEKGFIENNSFFLNFWILIVLIAFSIFLFYNIYILYFIIKNRKGYFNPHISIKSCLYFGLRACYTIIVVAGGGIITGTLDNTFISAGQVPPFRWVYLKMMTSSMGGYLEVPGLYNVPSSELQIQSRNRILSLLQQRTMK
jgi:hypothetical protein